MGRMTGLHSYLSFSALLGARYPEGLFGGRRSVGPGEEQCA